MSAQNFRTITVPANSSVREEISGKYYATVSTTALFFVRSNNGQELEQNAGRTFGGETSEFSVLTFYNRNASAVTLTYYAGNTPYQADPSVVATIGSVSVTVGSTVTNALTYTKGTTGNLASGATLPLTGLDGAKVRKSFSIFNDHATDPLIVRGANGTAGHKVPAQTGYPLESGGGLTIYNPGSNAIDYYIMEVFYS